ncbi:MAG: hypothetical protein ACJ76V_03105, partial [Thermoleophilaceae bacterium]
MKRRLQEVARAVHSDAAGEAVEHPRAAQGDLGRVGSKEAGDLDIRDTTPQGEIEQRSAARVERP